KYGGHEIKTIGDSLMVAFRTAVEALDFALGLQANTGDERIRLRAGIHVGPVHVQETDAFGLTVNYTARVMRMATAEEIWCSDRTKGDIEEEKAEAHKRLCWTEHPQCELKGIAGRQRLWSVVVPTAEP